MYWKLTKTTLHIQLMYNRETSRSTSNYSQTCNNTFIMQFPHVIVVIGFYLCIAKDFPWNIGWMESFHGIEWTTHIQNEQMDRMSYLILKITIIIKLLSLLLEKLFLLTKQKSHFPQSSVILQAKHSPHLLLARCTQKRAQKEVQYNYQS